MPTNTIQTERLLPRPRLLDATEGEAVDLSRCRATGALEAAAERLLGGLTTGDAPTAVVRTAIDARDVPAGGYRIVASGEAVRIEASGEPGARHALATLANIRATHAMPVSPFRIEDAPSFPTRGLMLDISRCRVPTMASLFELLDELERMKFNHLQLYTEHTFAYREHEEVWSGASPMTPHEIRALDDAARERGIELCPNQNTLGHMERWFAHDAYLPLAEITDRGRVWTFETDDGRSIDRAGPFSLCATDPDAVAFARGLLSELLPCFSSGRVNIGLDEAIDLGQGRSKDAVRVRGRAGVFMDFLNAMSSHAEQLGKRAMFWADMPLRHPEAIARTPNGATALVWGYEGDAPFAAHAALLREHGIDTWVCPGTSCWRSLCGRSSVRRENVANAARAGAAHGATGFLLTEWGDLGHRQHWPVSLHAIRMSAQAAWDAGSPDCEPRAAHPDLGPWVEALGDLDAALRAEIRNSGAMFRELDRTLVEPSPPPPDTPLGPWIACASDLDDLRASLPASGERTSRELRNTLDLCEVGVRKAIARRESALTGRAVSSSVRLSIAEQMRAASDERRGLWLGRAREGGLAESLGYDARIIDDLLEGTSG